MTSAAEPLEGEGPSVDEIEARLREHPDLLERLRNGDARALLGLLEVGTEAEVDSATVRIQP